jgi:hypothetical protein
VIENSGHRPDCDTRCDECAASHCLHPSCVHPRSAPSHLRRDSNCAAFVPSGRGDRQVRCDCYDTVYPGEVDANEPPARLATF